MNARYLGVSTIVHLGVLALIVAAAFGVMTHNTIDHRATTADTLNVISLYPGGAGAPSSSSREAGPRIHMPVIKAPLTQMTTLPQESEVAEAPQIPSKPSSGKKPTAQLTQEQFNTLHGRTSNRAATVKAPTKVNAPGYSELAGNTSEFAGAGAGQPSGEGGAAFEAALMGRIQALLKANKAEKEDLVVAIAFVVSGEGNCKGARVHTSSGDPSFDAMVLDSVRQARITPVPAEYVGRGYCINIRSRN